MSKQNLLALPAFLIAESFIADNAVTLILGDNIFYGSDSFYKACADFKNGASIFGYHVNDPERYGVVEFGSDGRAISIEEKPKHPKSNYAVPGLYSTDREAVSIAKALKPSARGELEITDMNLEYMRRGRLHVHRLSRGFAWLDAGTSDSLHEASAYVQDIESLTALKLAAREAAFRKGFLALSQLEELVAGMPKCDNGMYLSEVVAEAEDKMKSMLTSREVADIVLLGASGYIGEAFARELQSRGSPFISLTAEC